MEPPVKKTIDFMPARLGKHLPMGGSKKTCLFKAKEDAHFKAKVGKR